MHTLLLILIVVLLLMDLYRHRDCGVTPPVRQPKDSISRQARTAEIRIKRVTDQALRAMVAEARRWEPGGR